MKWRDLAPDPRMVAALEEADRPVLRAVALLGAREMRHKWSNAFADACARMLAAEVRNHSTFKGLHVLPGEDGDSEPPTYVAGQKRKRVDVVVSSLVSGLQVGISLKGMNFRDEGGWQFDKNLTGRTYELQDEVRLIHEYQPAAFLVAVYFLPLGATEDKKSEASESSFARTVQHLRARTGRLDASLPSQLARVDMAVVALYVPGDVEVFGRESYSDSFPRGVVRFLDVLTAPPRRGRPRVETTLSLGQLVDLIAERYQSGGAEPVEWSDPEPDDETPDAVEQS